MIALLPSDLAGPVLLGSGGAGQTCRNDLALNIPLGDPGRCPDIPTLSLSIFDDSGSVLGGADSTGRRYEEAALAINKVARRCRCGRDLVGVLHMNRPSSGDLAPTALKGLHSKSASPLTDALRVPTDGDGASVLAGTLTRARSLAESHPQHLTVLSVFSDFELFENLPRLWADMGDFPGKVHAVVLRAQPPPTLEDDERISVTTVSNGTPPGAVARALFADLTHHRRDRKLLKTAASAS